MSVAYDILRFKKVVETGSISEASRLLYVSQPALSKSIRLLEEHYGVELLDRHAQGVTPTPCGTIVYRAACEIERSLLSMEREMLRERSQREPAHARTAIHIGCSTIWNDFLMPEVMQQIDHIDAYEIHVTNDTSEQLLSDLLETERYDFVLCRMLDEPRYAELHHEPLLKSQPAIFVSEHHPVFRAGFDKERLGGLKWVKLKSLAALRRTDLTPAGLSLVPKSFFQPAISFEVEDLMTAAQLVRDDYAILLPLALAGLLERYGIKPLPFPRTLTNSYWLGMVRRRATGAPLHVMDLMTTIKLFVSAHAALQNQ